MMPRDKFYRAAGRVARDLPDPGWVACAIVVMVVFGLLAGCSPAWAAAPPVPVKGDYIEVHGGTIAMFHCSNATGCIVIATEFLDQMLQEAARRAAAANNCKRPGV